MIDDMRVIFSFTGFGVVLISNLKKKNQRKIKACTRYDIYGIHYCTSCNKLKLG